MPMSVSREAVSEPVSPGLRAGGGLKHGEAGIVGPVVVGFPRPPGRGRIETISPPQPKA